MLSAPGNLPNSQYHTPFHPCGCSPLPQPLCQGLCMAPSFHPRRCWGVHQLRCFLVPPSPPPLCNPLSPAVHAAALPQLKLSPPPAQSKRQLRSRCSNRSEGAPAPQPPRARQPPCRRSFRRAAAGAAQAAAPGPAPTQLPGRVTGTWGKQNPGVNAQIHPTDLEMQPWCSI